MTTGDPFSVEAARRAAIAGRLDAWVTEFLASPGSDNEALAAELAFHGVSFYGPVRVTLDELRPLAGPDDHDVTIRVPAKVWNEEVHSMDESLALGWQPPPLLISRREGEYVLEDGNHRHDALRRAGATHTWAVIAFWEESERIAFLSLHDPEALTPPG